MKIKIEIYSKEKIEFINSGKYGVFEDGICFLNTDGQIKLLTDMFRYRIDTKGTIEDSENAEEPICIYFEIEDTEFEKIRLLESGKYGRLEEGIRVIIDEEHYQLMKDSIRLRAQIVREARVSVSL